MANISIIAKARDHALRMIPNAKQRVTFELAQQAVRGIVDAAQARRTAYRSQPRSRAIIYETGAGAWELFKVMNEVLADWDNAEKNIDTILITLFLAVKHIDGTPTAVLAEPDAETIKQVVAMACSTIRSKINLEASRPLAHIGKDLAHLIDPAARADESLVESLDDQLEHEGNIPRLDG